MFAAKDTSQLKMVDGYPEGKYCQYSSQRSLCYEAKKQNKTKQRFNKSLVSCSDLIVLDVGPLQVSLIRMIRFYSRDVNKTARDCEINEWFCRIVFFFFLCVNRHTIEFNNSFLS